MGRLSITIRIWLSIGIFVAGFLLSTIIAQVEGAKTESGLRVTAEVLYPAARKSHEASALFQDMVREFRDGVVIGDPSAVGRGARQGRAARTSCPRCRSNGQRCRVDPDHSRRSRCTRRHACRGCRA